MTYPDKNDYNLYWGDIHRQTAWTCGEGTPDDHFQAARDHFKLDFAAVTDNACLAENPTERLFPGPNLLHHRHFINGLAAHSISAEQWTLLQEVVRRNSRDGQFIALLGYEWCSARFGDHNIYFNDDRGELFLPHLLTDLYQGVANRTNPRLIIPHHPGYSKGRRGVNWNFHDPFQERLVEIYSTQHGCSENETSTYQLYSKSMGYVGQGTTVQSALERGYKLGFTAGSDSHHLYQKSGITGVFTKQLSRKSLFEGLWNRRTIASTGPQFGAWFEIDGFGPGSILAIDALPSFTITTFSNEWEQVELIRNGEIIQTWRNQGENRLEYIESGAGIVPDNYYYVRIQLPEQETVWISPIWVSYLPDTPLVRDTLYWLPDIGAQFWGREISDEKVVLKIWNSNQSTAAIKKIQFETLDRNDDIETIYPVESSFSLMPGELGEVCLSRKNCCSFRITYRDVWDNLRIIHRRQILRPDEPTVFLLENSNHATVVRQLKGGEQG